MFGTSRDLEYSNAFCHIHNDLHNALWNYFDCSYGLNTIHLLNIVSLRILFVQKSNISLVLLHDIFCQLKFFINFINCCVFNSVLSLMYIAFILIINCLHSYMNFIQHKFNGLKHVLVNIKLWYLCWFIPKQM